jgi:mono/diheme cytochrome c family protein
MYQKLHFVLLAGIVLCLAPVFFLRRDPSKPHYELVPERQMARSPAFGAFAPNPNFPDGTTFQAPPKGTIARGSPSFPYGPEPTEMVRAGKELRNPLSFGPQTKQQGAMLYSNYCQCCHGPTGMGDGPVSERGYPKPLSFLKPQAMDMKDGEMFHIVTYGKGNMPAHAVQLAPADRWAVILHVRVLQNKYTEFPNISVAETKQVYQNKCLNCHGEDGAGSVMRATKYPNIPDFSSLAWQLSKTNLEITNRIEYGDEPLMPAFRYQLPRNPILGLSIYLRSFAIREGTGAPKPAPLPSTVGLEPVQIFRAYCLACHNVDGKGAIVRPGMPDIPDFTSAKWHASKKDPELSKSILAGGKFMPPMKDKLAPAAADKMVQFVRGFKDGAFKVPLESKGEVAKEKTPIPPDIPLEKFPPAIAKGKVTPEPTSPEVANRLRAAGVVFREYCIVCHGSDGTGAPAMRPALPTLPDFTKVAFRDQHSDTQLLISILDGKGTLMPANRGRINETQARDLVAYVRAFAPPGEGTAVGSTSEFQQQFEQLQRQWEALEREIRALKKEPTKR